MNCPKCKSAIMKLGRSCGGCGYDFGEELYDKFSFYFSWKDEHERLSELQNSLYAALANVSAKIRRYEEVLKRELEQAGASPAPARKKRARTKNKRR